MRRRFQNTTSRSVLLGLLMLGITIGCLLALPVQADNVYYPNPDSRCEVIESNGCPSRPTDPADYSNQPYYCSTVEETKNCVPMSGSPCSWLFEQTCGYKKQSDNGEFIVPLVPCTDTYDTCGPFLVNEPVDPGV